LLFPKHPAKEAAMFAPYLVALVAASLAATSALTFIYLVNHFDPPERKS
jgi:hypothetical protein